MEQECFTILSQLESVIGAKASNNDRLELSELLTRTATNLIKLRQAAKNQVEEVERRKTQTAQSKSDVEVSNLQLQNLLYEKNYYTKEIATCRSFTSKYSEEDTGLVTEDTFRQEAPESFKEGTEDEHRLQQQRLEYEKHQRLVLLKQLEAVKLRKAQQDQVVATKRKRLEDLQTQLVSLREAAHAIKDHLALPGVSAAERRKALASSALLPTPLYVLYHQLAAVKEASDERISITVTGSQKQAEAWAQSSGAEFFEASGKALESAPKRRKTDSQHQSAELGYLTHPLAVTVEVSLSAEETMQLHFFYLAKLECVTVKAELQSHQQLLAELFPGDTGAELPNELPHQQSADGVFAYDASRPDRPFLWAQHLAGLDFLPALTQLGQLEGLDHKSALAAGVATYRRQRRVQAVLRALRSAAAAAAIHGNAETSLQAAAAAPDAAKTTPVKRIRTWEEIVQERSRPTSPKLPSQADVSNSSLPKASSQGAPVATIANESDEEEGQLPQDE